MKIFRKLVRDNIPEIIKKDNKTPNWRILDNNEYKQELLKKLIEESEEVLAAKNDKEELTKELGDLLEVIDSTMKAFGVNFKEVSVLKDKRKSERGGFDKRVFLESVE